MSAKDADRPVHVLLQRVADSHDLALPEPASAGASGFDLRARVAAPLVLAPGERVLVPTGIAIALPPGFEAQVRPRSGLALSAGLSLLNAPGTIDADYRGEVGVVLINLGQEPVRIERGDRIAQLVIQRLPAIEWVEVESLPTTSRGSGGFGHTGTR